MVGWLVSSLFTSYSDRGCCLLFLWLAVGLDEWIWGRSLECFNVNVFCLEYISKGYSVNSGDEIKLMYVCVGMHVSLWVGAWVRKLAGAKISQSKAHLGPPCKGGLTACKTCIVSEHYHLFLFFYCRNLENNFIRGGFHLPESLIML